MIILRKNLSIILCNFFYFFLRLKKAIWHKGYFDLSTSYIRKSVAIITKKLFFLVYNGVNQRGEGNEILLLKGVFYFYGEEIK